RGPHELFVLLAAGTGTDHEARGQSAEEHQLAAHSDDLLLDDAMSPETPSELFIPVHLAINTSILWVNCEDRCRTRWRPGLGHAVLFPGRPRCSFRGGLAIPRSSIGRAAGC